MQITLRRQAIDEMVVTAQAMIGADITNGVGSSFTASDIANQPATDRDVIRTLLRDPLAQSSGTGNLSVAGVNPRFNGLSIDGSMQQNDLGLGSDTYATARSPINIDAIESVSLVASDYSATATGFTGGLVNLVTKSGGNDFEGSLFCFYQDDDFVGDKFSGGTFDPGAFKEKEYGFTLGGPIIPDRLFFFVSYDEFDSAAGVDFASQDQRNGIEPGFFSALNGVIQDVLGFDAQGRPAGTSTPETSERALVKLDWNISDQHRASFTYQSTEETGTSINSESFVSAWYDIPVDLTAYTAQLFSDWNDRLSTTLRFNFKEFQRGQICRAGPDLGAVEIRLTPDELQGTALDGLITDRVDVTAGCDRFRHANEFEDERLQLFASADYDLEDHLLTFGAEYEEYDLFNLFVQSSRGRFQFRSFDNLINRAPQTVFFQNVPSNNVRDGAAEWGYDKVSFFLQDRWQVNPDLEFSFGLRYERFMQDDEPTLSQDIVNRFGLRSDANLDGNDLWMPRVSFRWDALPRTTVTGGVGLFAGGNPQVWVSNAFQAPTVIASARGLTDVSVSEVPQVLLDEVAAGQPTVIDVIAEDFKTPSDWKASLRVEHDFDMQFAGLDLGSDYQVSAQYLYTRARDGFLWRNRAQLDLPEALPTGVAPDGRTIYADLQDLGISNLTELGNFSGGNSHVFSISLAKAFANGFDFQVSYAHQNIEAVTEGTSSRGVSAWRGITDIDRNYPSARTSPFEVAHSFKVNLGYERDFFRGLNSRFDLFGIINSGDNFTYTFRVDRDNALFGRAGDGESPFDNNPLYVPDPSGDSRVVFASEFDTAGFFDFVDRKGIPTGRIATVNADRSGWNDRFDLRFQQELPGIPGADRFLGENRLKLVLDIENVLNLLNKSWGNFKTGPRNAQQAIVEADLVSAADVAANGVDGAVALTGDAPRGACLSAGDCVFRFQDFRDLDTNSKSASRSVWGLRVGIRWDF